MISVLASTRPIICSTKRQLLALFLPAPVSLVRWDLQKIVYGNVISIQDWFRFRLWSRVNSWIKLEKEMHDGGFLSCPEIKEKVYLLYRWRVGVLSVNLKSIYVLLSYFLFGAKDVRVSIIIGRMAYKQYFFLLAVPLFSPWQQHANGRIVIK